VKSFAGRLSQDGRLITVRAAKAGRYHVDEISADPLPSGHTSRRRGVGIKRDDGTIAIEPDPWPEASRRAPPSRVDGISR
jgi:hypothetical protein